MAILSLFLGLSGCKKTPEYTPEDIREIHISCGHMDYTYAYSFSLKKADESWLFSADCSINREGPHIELEDCPVAQEEAEEIIEIIREQDIIESVRRFKKPNFKWHALDETTYYTSFLFADGKVISSAVFGSRDMEELFFCLAAKYA